MSVNALREKIEHLKAQHPNEAAKVQAAMVEALEAAADLLESLSEDFIDLVYETGGELDAADDDTNAEAGMMAPDAGRRLLQIPAEPGDIPGDHPEQ